ncbi:PhzF family phenazine biosynthesis protein [Nisaea acidiphila]|uniref:PhzF family phenazine biosynthesis protein n=1 Tax=Nisaea acidiphila TaxID=1862145 RepID=A0A9J7ATK6_9PROT|nr:PhzF family phenazine biosynthesis protein [Nisaea acidiphila]UUX48701.1 PhzF family phenazine biosynthesis protein [Nisaea acidiphila]
MSVQRIASFSERNAGGNPAGVMIADNLPSVAEMQRIAAEVGFSETAFAEPEGDSWRVRYFSPGSEVPFCGHATIALGAALAMREGDGVFRLSLNEADITVEGRNENGVSSAALQSPPTRSSPASREIVSEVLGLFGYSADDLYDGMAPAWIHGGADHFLLPLKSREALAGMTYDLEAGRSLMNREGWVTIMLVCPENPTSFHARNAFASGGVYEDPATGAATAAFAGYLRDIGWPHGGRIEIRQGEDMGMRSRIHAEIPAEPGSSIRVSGETRIMSEG